MAGLEDEGLGVKSQGTVDSWQRNSAMGSNREKTGALKPFVLQQLRQPWSPSAARLGSQLRAAQRNKDITRVWPGRNHGDC